MKLLIIEDSERLRRSLTTGFSKLGYAVDSTEDGREGLAYALAGAHSLIILDLMLPSMDGISILRELRDRRNNTPVIILSARDQIDDRVRGLDMGADDYLCKPFAFDELHARVKTLIRRSHKLANSQIQFGSMTLDIALREVRVGEEMVALTPSEYSILECLAMNAGRVVSFDDMENHIYTASTVVSRNAIEAHVSSLRKKIRIAGESDLVKTRRGFGYYIDKKSIDKNSIDKKGSGEKVSLKSSSGKAE